MMAFDSDSVTSSICQSAVTHTHTHIRSHSDSWCPCNTQRHFYPNIFSASFLCRTYSFHGLHIFALTFPDTHTHTAVCLIFLIGCIPRFLSRCLYCMTYTNTLTVVIINHIHTDCAPLFHSLCVIQILYTALRSLHLLKMTDMWSKSLCHAHYFGARYHAGIHMFVVL